MSDLIPAHHVKAYSANVWHECQQKMSRLRSVVRNETFTGEESYFDSYGSVEYREKLGRNEEIVYDDTPHNRRKVSTKPYYYSDLTDWCDKLRMIHDPTSQYVKAASMALMRGMDDIVIAAALGPAYYGKTGSDLTNLPDTQKLVSTDGATAGGVPLNVKTLRAIKRKFDENECDEKIYMAVTAADIQSLLSENEITSSDYNTIRALVAGEINTFMGIEFIRTERLPLLGADTNFVLASGQVDAGGAASTTIASKTYKRSFAFTQMGLLLGLSKDIEVRVDQIPQKHYSWQVYACMKIGGVRMEDLRVVEVISEQC